MKLVPYAHAYRQNAVQTASPGQLILMLFDGALRFMNCALQGFEEIEVIPRHQMVHNNLIKTQAIIDELQSSLNHDAGKQFARTMSDLYDYIRNQLREANVRKIPGPVNIVVELLGELRSAWAEMLAQTEGVASMTSSLSATAA